VISCLGTKSSLDARGVDRKYLKTTLDAKIRDWETSGLPRDSEDLRYLKETRKMIPTLIKTKGYCSGLLPTSSGESQFQEAFSDWVAAEVIAQGMGDPSQSDLKTRASESIGFFSGLNCPKIKLGVADYKDKLMKKLKCEQSTGEDKIYDQITTLTRASARNDDEHPYTSERMNSIFFSQPILRAAFGCKTPSRYKHCE
jgi:hypothetical protein